MQALRTELEHRWESMFAALAVGDDVAPSRRLRTEGLMEAAVLLGATEAELDEALVRCHCRVFDRAPADVFGGDWRTLFPFPQIPAMAKRAPVIPSTSD